MIDRLNNLDLFFSILLQSVSHLLCDIQHQWMGDGNTILNLNVGKRDVRHRNE